MNHSEPNKEGIWNEQFLKWSPFIWNCPTVPFPRLKSSCGLFLHAVPHFSFLSLPRLSLLVPCHSPLCHSFGPSLFVTSAFDPSPSLSPSLPHFLGWLLCSVHIEAFLLSLARSPFTLYSCLQALECRIMSFVAHIFNYSCLFYCGLWLFLCCEVHVYEWVCALSLSFILSVFSLCLSNETCLHLTVFCPPFMGINAFLLRLFCLSVSLFLYFFNEFSFLRPTATYIAIPFQHSHRDCAEILLKG